MPVKIITDGEKLTGASGVTHKEIKAMVKACRTRYKGILKWSHFEISEILQLLIDNKIVKGSDTIDAIINNTNLNSGIKIFIGSHIIDATMNTTPTSKPNYKDHTTTILCTTTKKDGKWANNLEADINTISGIKSLGSAVDRTLICEPDCNDGDDA